MIKRWIITLGVVFLLLALAGKVFAQTTNVVGYFDNIHGGWAVDLDSPSKTVTVQIWAERGGIANFVLSVEANKPRTDLKKAGIGDHAFAIEAITTICDGREYTIRAYGLDVQTGNSTELTGSGLPLTCGTKAAPIQGSVVSGATGRPIMNARVTLFRMGEDGRASFLNSQAVGPDGTFSFEQDFAGGTLNDGIYQTWAAADGYIYNRATIDYLRTSGASMVHWLTRSQLSARPNGQPATIASVDGQFDLPVEVCNNGYTGIFGQFAQAALTLSGPGQFSEFVTRAPVYNFFAAPPVGQCRLFLFSMAVPSSLPDGQTYCMDVKIGDFNLEEFARASGCGVKGLKQNFLRGPEKQ